MCVCVCVCVCVRVCVCVCDLTWHFICLCPRQQVDLRCPISLSGTWDWEIMNVFTLILTVTLCWLPSVQPSDGSGCGEFFDKNVAYTGICRADVMEVAVCSRIDCALLCSKTEKCNTFTYNDTIQICQMGTGRYDWCKWIVSHSQAVSMLDF